MNNLDFIVSESDKIQAKTIEVANKIFDAAETSYDEVKSSEALVSYLKENGFEVEMPFVGIPTSFKATYGSGKPVIGILAEYDALHGLSQEAFKTEKCEITPGGNGHGCGHNLLGSGCAHAGILIKRYLEENKISGTVIVFGCPAEENGSGKAFMAKKGAFKDLDCAYTWHPAEYTGVVCASTMANVQVDYHFKGIAAHAATAPHMGRSALDAVELMNVSCNYLREHIVSDARLHYAILDTGGMSPNVVQASACVRYLIRASKIEDVLSIKERVDNCARGASLMTDTKLEIKFVKACSHYLPNSTLGKSITDAVNKVGIPSYTKEEIEFIEKIRETTPTKEESSGVVKNLVLRQTPKEMVEVVSKMFSAPINPFVMPNMKLKMTVPGSSDCGDVSLNCPTTWLNVVTCAQGTPGHSWQMVAQGKSSVSHKGMVLAAKSVALSAIELLENKEILEEAWKEFKIDRTGKEFVSPIPDDATPPIGLV